MGGLVGSLAPPPHKTEAVTVVMQMTALLTVDVAALASVNSPSTLTMDGDWPSATQQVNALS